MTDYADQAPPRRQYDDMPETAGEDKSIGEAIGDVTRDLSVLVQQELALAKAEVRQTATRAGQTAGMFAGAAVAAFLFVVFLSIALWVAISDRTGPGWGAVIVAVIWLVAGVVLFLVARAQMKKISGIAADDRDRAPSSERTQRTRGEKPMTTSNDPDEIRADIERTRAALSNDVDELAETVKPQNVAGRQVDKVKEAASNIKDRVMGSDDDEYSRGAVGRLPSSASAARERSPTRHTPPETQSARRPPRHASAVSRAPATVKRKAQGNPLAAGVIAFGIGMLVSSLIPSTREGTAGGIPAAGEPGASQGEGL